MVQPSQICAIISQNNPLLRYSLALGITNFPGYENHSLRYGISRQGPVTSREFRSSKNKDRSFISNKLNRFNLKLNVSLLLVSMLLQAWIMMPLAFLNAPLLHTGYFVRQCRAQWQNWVILSVVKCYCSAETKNIAKSRSTLRQPSSWLCSMVIIACRCSASGHNFSDSVSPLRSIQSGVHSHQLAFQLPSAFGRLVTRSLENARAKPTWVCWRKAAV